MTMYVVIDRHTSKQVGKPYTNKVRALRRRDALDNAYGGYRYTLKTIEVS